MLYIHTFTGAKGYGYDEAILFSLIELVYTRAGRTTSTEHSTVIKVTAITSSR